MLFRRNAKNSDPKSIDSKDPVHERVPSYLSRRFPLDPALRRKDAFPSKWMPSTRQKPVSFGKERKEPSQEVSTMVDVEDQDVDGRWTLPSGIRYPLSFWNEIRRSPKPKEGKGAGKRLSLPTPAPSNHEGLTRRRSHECLRRTLLSRPSPSLSLSSCWKQKQRRVKGSYEASRLASMVASRRSLDVDAEKGKWKRDIDILLRERSP